MEPSINKSFWKSFNEGIKNWAYENGKLILFTEERKWEFSHFESTQKENISLEGFIEEIEKLEKGKEKKWHQHIKMGLTDAGGSEDKLVYFSENNYGYPEGWWDEHYPEYGSPVSKETGKRLYMHFKLIEKAERLNWSAECDLVILDSGDFLLKHYGKYNSDLGIIVPKDHSNVNKEKKRISIFTTKINPQELNISMNASLEAIRGKFFTSKKGSKLFKLDEHGPHLLIRDDWGGCFNDYRGGSLPKNQLYFRRASSNGGGAGYDYAVVPIDWKQSISEDDL